MPCHSQVSLNNSAPDTFSYLCDYVPPFFSFSFSLSNKNKSISIIINVATLNWKRGEGWVKVVLVVEVVMNMDSFVLSNMVTWKLFLLFYRLTLLFSIVLLFMIIIPLFILLLPMVRSRFNSFPFQCWFVLDGLINHLSQVSQLGFHFNFWVWKKNVFFFFCCWEFAGFI